MQHLGWWLIYWWSLEQWQLEGPLPNYAFTEARQLADSFISCCLQLEQTWPG